jgi:hypothetical protein
MSTIIRSAFVALILTSASAAMAQDSKWVDKSQPHGGYAPNSQEGNRAFWDYQGQHGD